MLQKCVRCESIFDLNYDLELSEGEYDSLEPLCWQCRSKKPEKQIKKGSKEFDIELILE